MPSIHIPQIRIITIMTAAFALLAPLSCGNSESKADFESAVRKLNLSTEAIGGALQSMRLQEERAASRKPISATLDTFWMALISTNLEMKRLQRVLTENPALHLEARNMWIGRIQGNLLALQENGSLTELNGPITSFLGEAYGQERVANEAKKMMETSNAIEAILNIQPPKPQ